MLKAILFTFCVMILKTHSLSFADDFAKAIGNDSLNAQLESLYQSKQYDEAVQLLINANRKDTAIIAQSHATHDPGALSPPATYYYDLGILYYRLGRLGLALGNFEKANRLSPHHSDIQFNLNATREALSRKMGGTEKLDPASNWVEQIADAFSENEIRTDLGILALIITLLWLNTYWRSRSLRKTFTGPIGWIGWVGLSILVGLNAARFLASSSPSAISVEKQTIKSGPGDHYVQMGILEEGTKIRLLGPTVADSSAKNSTDPSARELWRQIRYSADEIGWVKASGLLTL